MGARVGRAIFLKVISCGVASHLEREFFIDNLLVRIHFIIGKPLKYIPHGEDRNIRILVSGIFAMRVAVPSHAPGRFEP